MPDSLIREFCAIQSGVLYSANTKKRKGVLLQISDDINYNIGKFNDSIVFGDLDFSQYKMPIFVTPLLYYSAIDLIARVRYKKLPTSRINGKFFKDSAELFFGLSEKESEEIWELQNLLFHQYSIEGFVMSRSRNDKIIEGQSNGDKP